METINGLCTISPWHKRLPNSGNRPSPNCNRLGTTMLLNKLVLLHNLALLSRMVSANKEVVVDGAVKVAVVAVAVDEVLLSRSRTPTLPPTRLIRATVATGVALLVAALLLQSTA
jgi:hypothetical protein